MMTTTTDEPRVWIGCLACYNAGRLTGEWFDAIEAADITPEQIHGRETSHEELWVMDHENFLGVLTGECSPMEAQEIAEALAAVGDDERPAFAAWVADVDGDVNDPDRFRDEYRGEWESLADYAQNLARETAMSHEVAALLDDGPWPFNCIDWNDAGEQLGRDGEVSTVHAPNGNVWVFSNY